MRIINKFLAFACCLIPIGCAHNIAPYEQEKIVLRLDNDGGFAHAGRRIVLYADATYTNTFYTDVVGNEFPTSGQYKLNPEKNELVLSSNDGKTERLFRINYSNQPYWIHETEQERIIQPNEDWLREISLKGMP